MNMSVQRPSGVNVGVNNPGTVVYIKGNEATDGSIRLLYTLGDDLTRIERRTSGVWNITRFNIINEIIVQQASDLAGTLDSSANYLIDGVVDMGSQSITVPQGGLQVHGLGFGTSKLISTENNYTMFVDDGVYSGDLFLTNLDVEVSGTSSKVWDLDNNENGQAVECISVNFLNCVDLGSLDSFRQFLWSNVALINCVDGVEFIGVWSGGMRATTAIIVQAGVTATFTGTLFKAGAGLTINGRFLTDFNAEDIADAGTFCDFAPANIIQNSRFQVAGLSINPSSNSFPNMPASSVKARFRNCDGTPNTYVGGQWTVTTETATTITTQDVAVKVAGTTTYTDLQHFTDGGGNNSLTYIGTQAIGVQQQIDLSFTGPNNNELTLTSKHWVAATSSYVDLAVTGPFTLNGAGRGEPISLHSFCTFNTNDRFEVWVTNTSSTGNVTAKNGGIISITERSS